MANQNTTINYLSTGNDERCNLRGIESKGVDEFRGMRRPASDILSGSVPI
jgi:hypothetical protein